MSCDDVESIGLNPVRWQSACELAQRFCDDDVIPAVGMCVGCSGGRGPVALFGRQRFSQEEQPLRDDAIFLIASITKPVVATAAMILLERGLLSLSDRVCDVIPEFGGTGRYGITIRHLLTHTSGLPDMLPNNRELRQANAPLMTFVEDTCQSEPAFPPGCGVQYQSMGFAILGEIIARISGKPCATFLQDEIFRPLGMNDTALGAPDHWFPARTADGLESSSSPAIIDRIAEIRLPPEQTADDDWNWNSRYWRSLGAPWGGILTTPADLSRFAQMMLNEGRCEDLRLLTPAGVRAATRNQLTSMRGVPQDDRRVKPWGLGWRLHWPAHSANFGDLLGPRTYGHWGATGTLLWMDPDLDAFALILTTQPQEPHGKQLALLSNTLAAAFEPSR